MGRNFDPFGWRRRRQQRLDRWNDRLDGLPWRLNQLRLRLRRSSNGLALGVLSGIAESCGFGVRKTSIIGCIIMFMLSSGVGANGFTVSLLVAAFFYLLAAVLMRGPETGADRLDPGRHFDDYEDEDAAESPVPPPAPRWETRRPRVPAGRVAAQPYQRTPLTPRVDFAALDRQLEGLNRRIQQMEGIVTDRRYDWDRRMES